MPSSRLTLSHATALLLALMLCGTAVPQQLPLSQQLPWSQRMANAVIAPVPGHLVETGTPLKWNYELATLLNGMDAVWYSTADGAYFRYIKQSMDALVLPDGSIPTYNASADTLDNLALGRELLLMYRVTLDARYYKAAVLLRQQLAVQPRTASGGFWHKKIYPDQMWLDGLYMAEPFYAEYASVFHEPQDFADITKQFTLIEAHARDPKTGLLYHAWDQSRKQRWANPSTGASHVFWARGMGWYMMALVDTLPYYPQNDPDRARLIAILNRTAEAVARVQDARTGLWYQVLDKPGADGNYFESSAACMFVYALQKGVRLGYLPEKYSANAAHGWHGILDQFVRPGANGSVTLTGTVKGVGLGGTPYRDGSYDYYVHAPVGSNDPKGVGAFLLAATEMENAPAATDMHGDTVLVDAWFNSQQRKNAAGQTEFFHYKWHDFSNDGYSLLGHIFESHGAALGTLYTAPTSENLKRAQYYVIASPDIPAKNPHPHYATPHDGEQLAAWVRRGGVLLLFENDPANADIEHFNNIADRFGIHFNAVLSHHVVGKDYAAAHIPVKADGTLFHEPHVLYMKDTCTISVTAPARALVADHGVIDIATVKYGKGTVLAVVDPWLYNEYTDGRKDHPDGDNFAAGKELVRWLIAQHESLREKPTVSPSN
ncbi:MAG: glycoside hydrolase family 88 protein [Acidobacteriaceae bacterium]